MKWDWRETTVIKTLRKLHKMTTQIHGTIWLWTQVSHVQLQSSQGMVFKRSLRRAVQVPPARNFTLLHPHALLQNLKKNTSATFTLYRFLVLLCTKNSSLLVRLCNSENNGMIFSSSTIWTSKDKKETLTSTQKHFGAFYIPHSALWETNFKFIPGIFPVHFSLDKYSL